MAQNQGWKNDQLLENDLKKWEEILDYYMKRDFRDSRSYAVCVNKFYPMKFHVV